VGATASVLPSAGAALGVGLLVGGLVVPAVALAAGRAQARRRAGARGLLTAELVELLGGAAELVAFGASDAAEERVREADRRLVRLERRAALASGLGEALGLLAAGATTVAVLATAVAAHDAAALDIVLVAALTLLALASFEAVAPLPGAVLELAATVAAGGRVLDLIDAAPAVTDPAEPLPRPARRAPVALEHVTVRYGVREADALRDVGFTLEPGARIALVGPSGAGKTTVVNLLLRFLDPDGGRVTVGGHDVREYSQEDVRGMFAVAGQDTVLFDTTIRTNLLIARPDASDAELGDALRLARLDAWVTALPDGLDTRLGEDGAELSGGQRQRLVVARALVSSAPVLVLDEPTAHLDAATAERLMEDVLDAAGSRAVLLITHRPEGLARMDEVLTLRAGALTRSGR
jgi:thiol reductant ABC exporter CydC subunit